MKPFPCGCPRTPENCYFNSSGKTVCKACAKQRSRERAKQTRTHFRCGHPIVPENIVMAETHRRCKLCSTVKVAPMPPCALAEVWR